MSAILPILQANEAVICFVPVIFCMFSFLSRITDISGSQTILSIFADLQPPLIDRIHLEWQTSSSIPNCLMQWSSMRAKSPPRGRFHALWLQFCDLRDLGGDFGFQGDDFCRLKHTQMFNWFQKINTCYSGIKAFHARSTPWFVTKVVEQSGLVTHQSNYCNMVLWNASLHQIAKTTEIVTGLVGSQALRFSRRL